MAGDRELWQSSRRLVGMALLVEAILSLGGMSIILGSGGSKSGR